ncbi:magnesium-transporting ATPase [Carnobacterium maltaromaticum]|uniref:cation-translocating P-type ATPase n=1 Tax=Carnobacterium maltaromaticum TaxID=2751 RepID=UPI0010722240|nr:cation-translocating P-type ATPase [Carnobacterium maltaromaticum]MDT1944474.1 cation-translocating P-type ATPase [Carnobacterium maltaromaticum]MDT1997804.1 cation-translocating P-type ATPase [Carnobacterium maltaromaticum]TFJ27156.1 magnesium-transporting ATPase [Carnobacterium maltaromaticum]TFJ31228.1 magnesium-transporting ATPase [Carnobacterium maltaromaticum]TFJ34685.1 magnesium-transporting ATPase [Carnobacterium maltaromaticum]
MLWVKESIDEIVKKLGSNEDKGLDDASILEKQKKYGANEFEEGKKETTLEKVGHHLAEITTIILLVAAAISAYLALTTGYGWAKVIVILAIVVLNIVLGIYQENSAEKALDALKNMNAHLTTVIRSGVRKPIDAKELVPGDIIELQAGDLVPADARIIESSSLQVEESALTGESLPVEKDGNLTITEDVPLGDRLNMVYSGCLVTNGRAKVIVVETGMDTEMGKIASLINNTTKLKTPLQIRLKELAKRLSLVAIVAGILIFGIGVLIHGETMIEMLMVAISLSVAAVPETLPVIVTLTLTYGVKNMVKKNTIIRRIPAVETIGNTSVICSDKTGTLTQNKMQVQKIWAANALPKSVNELFTNEENQLLELLSISNNATVELIEEKEQIIGDPTESAIIGLLQAKGITKASLEEKYPRVFELPFDSERKLMTTIHKTDNEYIAITKGAFDRIPVTFSPELLNEAKRVHDEFAEDALRVISAAYQTFDTMPTELTAEALEHDLIFLGMVGMIDPPRPESRPAVLAAKKAGIKTVMITGDHIVTASAIAKEIGILEEGDLAITGQDLDKMNQAELEAKVRDVSVYARVSPEDKIRIVQAWQANGEIVAMTGDGVNDAPALKAADVGIAMGITGTDVSKNAADMILTDDNFATIVDAVAEGRTAYENIRKTIYFLLSTNFSQIFIMLIAVILGWGVPVVAVQLLLINVVSDGIPGFWLSLEKPDADIMNRKPIRKDAGIFANGLGKKVGTQAVVFTIVTLIGFYIGQFVTVSSSIGASYEVGMTMSFVILAWSSVAHIFNVRSDKSIFKVGILSNPRLFYSALGSMLIILGLALIPSLATIFFLVPMSLTHWIISFVLAMSPLVFVEIQKNFFTKK